MDQTSPMGWIMLASFFCLYMTPTIIAFQSDVRGKSTILFANFFFGWSVIGWFLCMMLAVAGHPNRRR